MPKRTPVKEENQPSITAILPNCPSSSKTEAEIETFDLTGDSPIVAQNIENPEFKIVNKRKENTDPVVAQRTTLLRNRYKKTQAKWHPHPLSPSKPSKNRGSE